MNADAYRHRSDAITSIAAFIGFVISLVADKGYEGADDWTALLASGIVFYNAIQLLRPGLAEIMDAALSGEIVDHVRELAAGVDEVLFIEKCYVRKMGFNYFVDLHIQVAPELSVAEGHRVAHLVKDKLMDGELSIRMCLSILNLFLKREAFLDHAFLRRSANLSGGGISLALLVA